MAAFWRSFACSVSALPLCDSVHTLTALCVAFCERLYSVIIFESTIHEVRNWLGAALAARQRPSITQAAAVFCVHCRRCCLYTALFWSFAMLRWHYHGRLRWFKAVICPNVCSTRRALLVCAPRHDRHSLACSLALDASWSLSALRSLRRLSNCSHSTCTV